ncbi:MAG: hypothetical protein ACFB21_16095 [Opitutales bacterium]
MAPLIDGTRLDATQTTSSERDVAANVGEDCERLTGPHSVDPIQTTDDTHGPAPAEDNLD